MSCKAIIDKCLYKGAITEKEHAKLLRNIVKVRCKDCKHYDKGTIFPCGIAADFIVEDDDYCSSAERREEC